MARICLIKTRFDRFDSLVWAPHLSGARHIMKEEVAFRQFAEYLRKRARRPHSMCTRQLRDNCDGMCSQQFLRGSCTEETEMFAYVRSIPAACGNGCWTDWGLASLHKPHTDFNKICVGIRAIHVILNSGFKQMPAFQPRLHCKIYGRASAFLYMPPSEPKIQDCITA